MADKSQSSSWGFYEHHFASARMAHYLAHFHGNIAKAESLYEWNNQVSAAFWELLAYLEVALRNTIDRQMASKFISKDPEGHWLMSENKVLIGLNSRIGRDLEEAKRRVKANGKDLTGEQMLSELSFNFWTLLVANKTKRYWPDLAGGFVGLPNRSSKELSESLNEIRNFRNRIGHHHRIWNLNLEVKLSKIERVAYLIDPHFSHWLKSKSRVEQLLKDKP